MPRFIFDVAGDTVAELDRDLDDAETLADRSIRHLDLEPVAAGLDAIEADLAQRVGPIDPVSGGGVVDRETRA